MTTKRFDRVEIKAAAQGVVTARFATLGVRDLDGDMIEPGAIGVQRVQVSQFGHSSWGGQLPVGVGVTEERGDEALADLQFFMDTTHGLEHFKTIKALGDLGQWSFGFNVLQSRDPTDDERQLGIKNVLQKLEIFEVSPVLRGAGIDTGTLAAKCDGCGVRLGGAGLSTGEWAAARRTFAAATTRLAASKVHRPTFVTEKLAKFAIEIAHELTGRPSRRAPPTLRWFLPDGVKRGYVLPGEHTTFLALDYGGEDLVRTCLHEAAHHRQVADHRPVVEPEAEAFAASWSRAVERAFSWSEGQTQRVQIREGQPPFRDIPKGHVVLARGALFNFNPGNKGDSWHCIAA